MIFSIKVKCYLDHQELDFADTLMLIANVDLTIPMNKLIITGIIVGVAAMMMMSVLPAAAAPADASRGIISHLHPPMNDGTSHGVAFITPDDDGKDLIAHTPGDNNGEVLTVGEPVYYTLDAKGKHIASVSHTNPDCTDGSC